MQLKKVIEKTYRHVLFDWASCVRRLEGKRVIEQETEGWEKATMGDTEEEEWKAFEGNEQNTFSKVTLGRRLGGWASAKQPYQMWYGSWFTRWQVPTQPRGTDAANRQVLSIVLRSKDGLKKVFNLKKHQDKIKKDHCGCYKYYDI